MSTLAEASSECCAHTASFAALAQLLPLARVPQAAWAELARTAIEPSIFFDPAFSLATLRCGGDQSGARALLAFSEGARTRLAGVLPVISAWRAVGLPIPVLFAGQPYTTLSTPLLARVDPVAAAGALIDAAAQAGQRVIVLPYAAMEGRAVAAFRLALAQRGLAPTQGPLHARAVFDASCDPGVYLRNGLGPKKLKELRRLRRRLEESGPVTFTLAQTPQAVGAALERFLTLEARGWKGKRGTGLGQDKGDADFAAAMVAGFVAGGAGSIAELTQGGRTLAAGIVLRQQDEAIFFKIAYDETLARFSPGVQLTLELTERFAHDPAIRIVDSTAIADHSMIDHVWRERRLMGELYFPTRRNDPLAPLLISLLIARGCVRARLKRIHDVFRRLKETRP